MSPGENQVDRIQVEEMVEREAEDNKKKDPSLSDLGEANLRCI
jgi:hypothetical protein